ncbi:hypothetical protein BGX23_011855 [Mortierella sp. AD031]|nr:hypothetical protein BGX23_011855 [Mortierella sp. AD031]
MCLKKVGPRRWISFVMVLWGGIMMCMAAVKNAGDLMAARFFLGVAECGLFPGVVYLFSLWYTRDEQALRNGVFFSSATMAGAFGGLLAWLLEQMDGVGGLHGWQWIFLLEGLPTVLLAAVVLWLLPDFPETATFLTTEEKELTIKRLRIDAGPATETHFSWRQFRMVFKDWKTYMHMATYILSTIPVYSLAFFLPTIVVGFKLDSTIVRYACLTLTAIGNFAAVPPMVSWLTSNIGGHTKRGVATAVIISFGNIGGAIGGQVYRAPDEANGFVKGHAICAGCLGFSVFLILTTKYLLVQENKRRDRLTPEEFAKEAAGEELCDLHPAWRYMT